MALMTRYSPVERFGLLRREMDRFFDEMIRGADGGEGRMAVWAPNTDISETDDRYIIRMDMPGLRKEDVKVELQDSMLTVSGERESEHEERKENVHRVERFYGHFYRAIPLPNAGSPEGVKAHMENGVLTIEVPKRDESKPRQIDVS